MNNSQFRRLLFDNSSPQREPSNHASQSPRQKGAATPSALGSRTRSSVPMTPRSVAGVDFAKQLAEYRKDGQPPTKKFKSSAAPKGSKLAAGYQDRTQLRRQAEDEVGDSADDKAKRVQGLEEMVKLSQIDQATFEKLRDEIGVGGDLGSTHLVKGLDWKLLKRVKEGEDVTEAPTQPETPAEEEQLDVEDELDSVLDNKALEAQPTTKAEKVKKDSMAPPATSGQKMSRDEILKQLKASRAVGSPAAQAATPSEPTLGSKFKKIRASQDDKKRWIETDEHGRRREVLITVDADGKTKRKVRWLHKAPDENGSSVPRKGAQPFGMEVPAEIAAKIRAQAEQEDEDDDIFAGVGTDYNPLGDAEDDSSSEYESEEGEVEKRKPSKSHAVPKPPDKAKDEASTIQTQQKPQNYFSTSSTTETEPISSNPLTQDPTILAALKRAAGLRQAPGNEESSRIDDGGDLDAEALLRRKRFLEEAKQRERQDALDMDLGFGESRFEDDEEEVYWDGEEKKSGRKRGPKKRKGNKDNVADVMGVLEGRKKSAS